MKAERVPKIFETVRKTITSHQLLEKRDKVLIAHSGGADSTALLFVMQGLQREYQLELFVGHFNHRLRPNASADEEFVRGMAKECGLPLFVASEDVRFFAEEQRLNLEEAARKMRYDFLKRTAEKIGGAKIATGHTMNDQAETFFLRLLRGSGLQGLGSIFPVVDGKIIRPLLLVERKEIENFLNKRGVAFRIDESNLERKLTRNKIRLDLIPYLQKDFEPNIIPQISKIVSILQDEESLMAKLAGKEAGRLVFKDGERIFLNIEAASSLPVGLARRIVRIFISKIKGDLREISFKDVEALLRLQVGESVTLKKDIHLKREKKFISRQKKLEQQEEYEYEWNGNSPLEIEELDVLVKAVKKKRGTYFDFDDTSRAILDSKKMAFPLLVRNRREGDRYWPLGSPGHKKLKEIMRAKAIPVEERDRRPVFVSKGKIIWVLGLPVAEECKIDRSTRELVILSVLPSVR